ncbi:UDP-N-acetylmuramoyl-tripeptide--D-alanyl-D-alanine ligase [Campylobacter lanienae]|uniref:Mur ligase family protein n=1 Tax=Campylobacter lanienae TaxID=75658 RepID=UPI0011ACABDD|nr:Mur ligase family protein [Campylobacter lanienae]TWO15506.1 UDP-N-acetylmuramoyl-tripeptide--D-alanyl-D-alanine ligase [Campylobacter lanienae]
MILVLAKFSFVMIFGYYVITALQWFSYKINRVIFHYTKPMWHIYFIILPLILISVFDSIIYQISITILYLIATILWAYKLDKRVVITARVKRFFTFLVVGFGLFSFCPYSGIWLFHTLFSLVFALVFSTISEKIIAIWYKNKALTKLKSMPNLKIILVTASFGKTSIKNFIYDIASGELKTHKTPRSVNTLLGIIRDINDNLRSDCELYIVEAGARLRGDIDEIAKFINPQIVVIGQIGGAHLEYFGSIDEIRAAKLEALNSNKLQNIIAHSSTNLASQAIIYDELVSGVKSTLDGLWFDMSLDGVKRHFKANLLGEFNSYNLAAAILAAKAAGVKNINLDSVKSVEHRLQKIEAGGKIIIDDSFNGNLNGMISSYKLVSEFNGRKILLTPGIVEGGDGVNSELSKVINDIFDIVVITSALNESELKRYLNKPEVFVLVDKAKMNGFLASHTTSGDLILFSNDAPSFI